MTDSSPKTTAVFSIPTAVDACAMAMGRNGQSSIMSVVFVDGSIAFYDALTGTPVADTSKVGAVCAASVRSEAADDLSVWVGCRDKKGIIVFQFDASNSVFATTLQQPDAPTDIVTALAASVNHRRVVSLGTDDRCRVWDTATLSQLHAFAVEAGLLTMAVAGPLLWCGSSSSAPKIYQLVSGQPGPSIDDEMEDGVEAPLLRMVLCMAFVAHSETVWCGLESSQIEVSDAWSGRSVTRLNGHSGAVTVIYAPAAASSGRKVPSVFSGGEDQTVREWHETTFVPGRVWSLENGYACCVYIVPCDDGDDEDSDVLWYGGTSGSIQLLRSACATPGPRTGASEVRVIRAALEMSEARLASLQASRTVKMSEERSSSPPESIDAAALVAENRQLAIEVDFFQKRVEELESENRVLQNDARGAGEAESPGGENEQLQGLVEKLKKELSDALEAAAAAAERADDYKEIAKESTQKADELELAIRDMTDRQETELLTKREQLSAMRTQWSAALWALQLSEANLCAAEGQIDRLMDTVDGLFEDTMRSKVENITSPSPSHRDAGPKAPALLLTSDAMTPRAAAEGTPQRIQFSPSEAEVIETMIAENASLRLQVDVLNQTLNRRGGESSAASSGAMTAAFLTLREELGDADAGAIVLEALQGNVQDESEGLENVIRCIARRLR